MHTKDADLLRQVRAFINAHLHRPLSTTMICRQFNTSKTALQYRFREYFGISPHAYILQGRMEKARLLLLDSGDPVKRIADLCGYKKVHSFNKAFRKHYGMAPGLYRKNCAAVKSDINRVESHLH